MMKKLSIIPLIAIFTYLLVSCGDEFLNKQPLSDLTEAGFFKTEEDANAALASVYDALQKYGGYENEFITKLEWLTVGDMRMEESPADREIEALVFNPNNGRFRDIWRVHYQGISRANTVIQRVPDMELAEEKKNAIIGQAKFLRGLFYSTLTRYYGDVPLILDEPNAATEFNVTRTPSSEVYAQVEQDLKDAISELPNEWQDADLGRASRTSALALLAKVHLFKGEWEQTIQRSEELISTDVHGLVDNYRDVFRKENEHNEETVFATQYRDTNAGGWGESRDGHFLAQRSAPRGVGQEFAPFGGWSNWVPNAHWVDEFETDGSSEIIDDRYDAMVLGPGDKHPELDFTMPDTVPAGFSSTGYVLTKWWFGPNPNDSEYSGQNIPVIRYAEVLLNYAEALNEVGRTSEAIQQLNIVRNRAGLDNLPTGLSQDAVLDAVFQERRIELFWEMSFFSDLNRRGRFLEFIEENRPDFADLVIAPYLREDYILFPIPQQDLDNNPSLTQNPGYAGNTSG